MNLKFSLLICIFIGAQGVSAPESVDGSKVGILIMGSILNTNPKNNVALIKILDTKKVKAVKKGFNVGKKYKVKKITEKYILLSEGAVELLVYQDKFAAEFRRKVQYTSPKLSSKRFGDAASYSEDGFERKDGNIRMTEAFRDNLVKKNLSKVLMQATAEPHMVNGKIDGFKLDQIDSGSMYDKAGLKDSDVVKSINGVELNSVAGAVGLLRKLKSSNKVEMQVMRGGSLQKIKIDVQ